jgi:hypothetical protein
MRACQSELECVEKARLALFKAYKGAAKIKGFEFDISLYQFHYITSLNCFYCGVEPRQKATRKNKKFQGIYYHNGIDRIDTNKGYISNNIIPCCIICNRMKMAFELEEFLGHVTKIHKHNYEL